MATTACRWTTTSPSDEVDAVTPLARQEEILDLVTEICQHDFKFKDFLEATDFFRKLINLCKQWNYSTFKSEQYESFKKQIKEFIK